MNAMDPPPRPTSSATNHPSVALFDVYLRLRPSEKAPLTQTPDRFLNVEPPEGDNPTRITIHPPAGEQHRKRAIERFAFTKVFEEDAAQRDIFHGTHMHSLIEAVLSKGRTERDGLVATLGVTGSGKSHTILGSKTQRGITQMALDVLYRNIGNHIVPSTSVPTVYSLAAADVSESQLFSATVFLESIYGDSSGESRVNSRAQTPMPVSDNSFTPDPGYLVSKQLYPSLRSAHPFVFLPDATIRPRVLSSPSLRTPIYASAQPLASHVGALKALLTRTAAARSNVDSVKEASSFIGMASNMKQRNIPRPSTLPQIPQMTSVNIEIDPNYEYAIVISMYEVYNDRIYDLLTMSAATAKAGVGKRRALLFKSTEQSPDRKVVAGLRKVICTTLNEALTVLETGLIERRVAGTGSNATSSRSHGFFCVEVKKRSKRSRAGSWTSSSLTVVDLAGSERARNAKTAGATLAEAGKINESLMYLGQCMQMQSDNSHHDNARSLVPYRQCKLTELLFSNSFPSTNTQTHSHTLPRNPQKAIMIVTADPLGDFNATSQILRYSALAREVTVPRIPSVTSTILSGTTANSHSKYSPGTSASGRSTPQSASQEDFDHAMQEITRLQEEMDIIHLRLADEQTRRIAAEQSWRAAEERMVEVEQTIRDECFDEMERHLEDEKRRWRAAWDEEQDRNDEHVDRKIEILSTAEAGKDNEISVFEDPQPKIEERVRELEDENQYLKRKIERLEREQGLRSPCKKQRVLKAKKWEVDVGEGSP